MYDVAVIGGGPGGYLAAERAAKAGKKVLLVEKNQVGGVCLNEGCIPTKTLLHASKLFGYAGKKGTEAGVRCENATFDHAAVVDKKEKVVDTLVTGVLKMLQANRVELVYGKAGIRKEAKGYTVLAQGNEYEASNVILATGSEPVLPNIPGVKEGIQNGTVLTSREVLTLREVPKELVIIGGGVIGLELAGYFNAAGSSVSVVEMLPKIGGEMDGEAADCLKREYAKKGIAFYLEAKANDVRDGKVRIEQKGKEIEIPYDKLLMCVGRRPVFDVEGLLDMGLNIAKGAVLTDKVCLTNLPGLYAVGDVNGKYMLAHVAYREAEVAVNHILGVKDEMRYDAIPGVVYGEPEVAYVGLGQKQAEERGYRIATKKASINLSGRHVAECGIRSGFIKIIVDQEKNVILGATLVSAYASEIIYALGLMIANKIPIESIRKTIFPHPTVSEVIREVLFD